MCRLRSRCASVCAAVCLVNFGEIGKRARRILAFAEGLFRFVDSMFPIVKYTGHAFLSPLKLVKWVWSEAVMTGMTVDPGGKLSCRLSEWSILVM